LRTRFLDQTMAPFILLAAEENLVLAFSRASILRSFVDILLRVVRIKYETWPHR
jgi:hypothetical protein